RADELMRGQRGAVALLNAQSGEILIMASHPTYDPNNLTEIAADLLADPNKPLINRAASGLYPTGSILEPFVKTLFKDATFENDQLLSVFNTYGFDNSFNPRIAVAESFVNEDKNQLYTSPLQMALASASFSNNGIIPTPRIAMAVNTPNDGWLTLPALEMPIEAIQPSVAKEAVDPYSASGNNLWSHTAQAMDEETHVTWFIAGTPANWQSTPLVVVVVLEENNPQLAQRIGRELLSNAMNP
ncbi:MAG TPA: penicillin-binding transpeptidase domain-containing protein, partial [Anaerolineales bacterium]|nr:penicillin-binding transpeptidase domain-containing protein [Anaerolineales bacterium]